MNLTIAARDMKTGDRFSIGGAPAILACNPAHTPANAPHTLSLYADLPRGTVSVYCEPDVVLDIERPDPDNEALVERMAEAIYASRLRLPGADHDPWEPAAKWTDAYRIHARAALAVVRAER